MFLNKNIILLLLGQGISGSVVSLLTFSSALAGKYLLDGTHSNTMIGCSHGHSSNFATMPISATLCGTFISVFYSSKLMLKFGRKNIFLWASLFGIIGAILAIASLLNGLFWLFCAATFLIGVFTALNQFYRFLATEAVSTKKDQNKATAIVVSGGIIGGILGPNLANIGSSLFNAPFVGSFIFVFLLCLFNFIITIPLSLTPFVQKQINKIPLYTCFKDSTFMLATLTCAFGFAFMTALMNAAPLAMNQYHLELNSIKGVLVTHFIAMYAPSLFLVFFIKYLTIFKIILLGVLSYLIATSISLFNASLVGFYLCLIFVGIGWAFSFNGGTFLLNTIKSEYKVHLQGLNAIAVFGSNLLASTSVGVILGNKDWIFLNFIALISIVLFGMIFLGLKCKKHSL